MQIEGIRIKDTKENGVTIQIDEILEKINDGNLFHWAILDLEATGRLKKGYITEFEEEITKSKNGYFITWEEIKDLVTQFYQIINIILIGCKDKTFLRRYNKPLEMYENCDIVIEMFDSSYWEVFSNDLGLIENFKSKFNLVNVIEREEYEKFE